MSKLLCWYDLQTFPANYDAVTFLVIAKSKVEQKGKKAHIIFVPKADKSNKKHYSLEEQEFRLNHILVPATYSLGLTYTLCRSREEAIDIYYSSDDEFFPEEYEVENPPKGLDRNTSLCHILEQYKMAKLFWPQPTKHALDLVKREFPERPFVITLRECYRESRNSNLLSWIQFAYYISDNTSLVFVRDTAKFAEKLHQFKTFPLASIDFDIRLALYHWARQNFSVGGGHTVLMHYSDKVNYRTFKFAPEAQGSGSAKFLESMGFPVSSQWSWANENQRIIWKDDTFENLKAEYDELETN